MKNFYLILALSLVSQLCLAQCDIVNQLLTPALKKSHFFDDLNGIAFGQNSMIATTDGGQNWQVIPFPAQRFDVEIFRSIEQIDDNTAFIVGDGGNLIKTSDKGQSWTPISLGVTGLLAPFVEIDFVNSNVGYISAYTFNLPFEHNTYLFKTMDGGNTWSFTQPYFSESHNPEISINFLSETDGFAWALGNLFRTNNGGANWTVIPNPSYDGFEGDTITQIEQTQNGTLIMACLDTWTTFYQSLDNGISWSKIDMLTPNNNIYPVSSAFEIVDNQLIIVASGGMTPDKNFIKYNLGDGTITSNQIPYAIKLVSDISFASGDTYYINDRYNVFWGDAPGVRILKTTNGGLSWTSLTDFTLQEPNSINSIKFGKNAHNHYTMAKQEGLSNSEPKFQIYTSNDNAATWQLKKEEVPYTGQLLSVQDGYISYILNTGAVSGSDGFTLYESHDSGQTWQNSSFPTPDNFPFFGFFKQLDTNTLQAGLSSEIYLSFDKGQNWITVNQPQVPNVSFSDGKVVSVNEIYMWGLYGDWPNQYDYYLYKTTDLGQTWQPIVVIPDNDGVDLGAIGSSTFFGTDFAFVSTGGNKYYHVDLNNNTFLISGFQHPVASAVHAAQSRLKILTDNYWLYLNYDNYFYYISNDQGLTWQQLPCSVCGDQILYDVSTNELFTYHDDHGSERIHNNIPPVPFLYGNNTVNTNTTQNYFILPSQIAQAEWTLLSGGTLITNGFSATVSWGTTGVHVLKVKLVNECGESEFYELSVNVTGTLTTNDYWQNTASVIPNPFEQSFTISLPQNTSPISIRLCNTLGKTIYQNQSRGESAEVTGLEKVPSGIYFLILESQGRSTVQKLIKE